MSLIINGLAGVFFLNFFGRPLSRYFHLQLTCQCSFCFKDVLGNAYLSLFFCGSQSPQLIKQCMTAYSQAVRIPY